MGNKSDKLRRPLGIKRYRKLIILAVEGGETEPDYFAKWKRNNRELIIDTLVQCIPGKKHNFPKDVLRRIVEYLANNPFSNDDEAWIIVDTDNRDDAQLQAVVNWASKKPNYHCGISNPGFEIWLLMHFENPSNINTVAQCIARLKSHLPGYDKHVDIGKITVEGIRAAIERARNRDHSPDDNNWPDNPGSTVYRLVEKIVDCLE